MPPTRNLSLAHVELERTGRYVYILKLADGSFYVGQTSNLPVRMAEHRDGTQPQTRAKSQKLVYFENSTKETVMKFEREKMN